MVILLAGASKADMRRVTISQCVRLFFLIAALPLVIVYISPGADAIPATPAIASIFEIVILVLVSAATGLLFDASGFPLAYSRSGTASAALGLGDVILAGA